MKFKENTGQIQTYQEQDEALIVTILLCKTGVFTDAVTGNEVKLTKADLKFLTDTYNAEVQDEYIKVKDNKKDPIGRIFLEKLLGKKSNRLSVDEITLAPVITEHKMHNSLVVGRVIGCLDYRDISADYAEIYCKLFVSTKEYVDKVKGGILNQISIGMYKEIGKLEEVSFTVYGAIDGAGIIRMSQNGITPDKTLLSKSIKAISTQLASVDNEIAQLDKQIHFARNKKVWANSVLGLVQFGKVYPRERNLILTNLLNMSSDKDRHILMSTIKAMPNAIDLNVYNKNKQALKMEELVMEQDQTKLVETAEDIASAVKDSLKFSKNKQPTTDGETTENTEAKPTDDKVENTEPQSSEFSKCPQFTKENAILIQDMLKNGKYDEANSYLTKFTDEAIASEQIQQTAMTATDNNSEVTQLETTKTDKEAFRRELLGQMGKLTDMLTKTF